MVSSTLRHKQSLAALPLPPAHSSASTPRWSGDSLAPSNGYSSLFTSGLMRGDSDVPSTPRIKCRPYHSRTSTSPNKSRHSPSKQIPRRQKSSILASMPSSPSKWKAHGTPTEGVESALDNVMRNLKLFARETRVQDESRWSDSSSDEEEGEERASTESSKPRKSEESSRSRMTVKSKRSVRSFASFRNKKGEEFDKMDVDEVDAIPPVPAVPIVVPTTPGRGRRALVGLAKKLGLTPKKKKTTMPLPSWPIQPQESEIHLPLPPTLPLAPPLPIDSSERSRKSSLATLRSLGKKSSNGTLLPLPRPSETSDHNLPRKSSLATLRSLGKKSSSGNLLPLPIPPDADRIPTRKSSLSTLRSLGKKTSTGTLRSMLSTNPPTHPFLTYNNNVTDCETPPLPGCVPTTPRRMPKSSIGQPKIRPTISPSAFIDAMPRKARTTPKDAEDCTMEEGETITFGTPDLSMTSSATPNTSIVGAITTPTSTNEVPVFDLADVISSTPNTSMTLHEETLSTPLTIKSAQVKPKKIFALLPKEQRQNMGLQSPAPNLRSARSRENLASTPALQGGLPVKAEQLLANKETTITRVPLSNLPVLNNANKENQPSLAPSPMEKPDGWDTPWPKPSASDSYFDLATNYNTFGPSAALYIHKRPEVPDFTKPMELTRSMQRRNASIDSRVSGNSKTGTGSRTVSVLGTTESGEEGWELERYLRELEAEESGVGMGR